MNAQEKLALLKENIHSMGSLVVAFSGGLDSTFLLAVAKEMLNENVLAMTAISATYPRRELLVFATSPPIWRVTVRVASMRAGSVFDNYSVPFY